MDKKELRLIFNIGFGLILFFALVWGATLYAKWREALNRPPVEIVIDNSQIDNSTVNP